MSVIVEIQCLIGKNSQPIIKEMCFIPVSDPYRSDLYLLKPPHNWHCLDAKEKKTNVWLEKNYHRLKWSDGYAEYSELMDILLMHTTEYSNVLSKGLEKSQLLSNLLDREVINLDDYMPGKISNFPLNEHFDCAYHGESNGECAYKNALRIRQWLRKIRLFTE